MGAQALLERGSRYLALITGPAAALAFRQREQGFVATAGTGAPVARADGVSREAGRAAAAALLDGHPQLDGIATVNDLLAMGVLEELRARGRRVPEDVQVVGFDDQPLMDVIGLSTVRQPMLAFGEWAARAIQALVRDPRAQVASVQLNLSFIHRTTTRPETSVSSATPQPRLRRKSGKKARVRPCPADAMVLERRFPGIRSGSDPR